MFKHSSGVKTSALHSREKPGAKESHVRCAYTRKVLSTEPLIRYSEHGRLGPGFTQLYRPPGRNLSSFISVVTTARNEVLERSTNASPSDEAPHPDITSSVRAGDPRHRRLQPGRGMAGGLLLHSIVTPLAVPLLYTLLDDCRLMGANLVARIAARIRGETAPIASETAS
jgi:hypothetical protein